MPEEHAGQSLDPAVQALSGNAAQTGEVAFDLKIVADAMPRNATDRNALQSAPVLEKTTTRPAAEPAVPAVHTDNQAPAGNPSGNASGNASGNPDGRSHQESQHGTEALARPERQRKAE